MTKVLSSTAVIPTISLANIWLLVIPLCGCLPTSQVNSTSLVVIGVPSPHAAPGCILKVASIAFVPSGLVTSTAVPFSRLGNSVQSMQISFQS